MAPSDLHLVFTPLGGPLPLSVGLDLVTRSSEQGKCDGASLPG